MQKPLNRQTSKRSGGRPPTKLPGVPTGRVPSTKLVDVRNYFRELLGPGWQMRLDEYFTETPIGKMKPYLVELAYHYAYGKPREKIEISGEVKTINLSILATEDLRALRDILAKARDLPVEAPASRIEGAEAPS